jgi:hypothetical protein
MVLTIEREPQLRRRWGRVVARAWDDDDFRCRLLSEPNEVLREEGIEVPPGVSVRVEEGDGVADDGCLHLPPKPLIEDLIEDDLGFAKGSAVARSNSRCACCCYCSL